MQYCPVLRAQKPRDESRWATLKMAASRNTNIRYRIGCNAELTVRNQTLSRHPCQGLQSVEMRNN
jgi:hypothetical protein